MMSGYDDVCAEVDKRQLLDKLYEYYGTHSLDNMSFMIKRDLKDPKKMRSLIDHVGFDDIDFFRYMATIFIEIFNKMTIKKVRLNLNVDEPEEKPKDES